MIADLTTSTLLCFISEHPLVVVDWWAPWCPPCQRMLKILPRLAEELDNVAKIGKINTDVETEAKQLYAIKRIPTFSFFKDGQEVYREEGRILTLEEIKKKVLELQ
jgi:thioredoxin 1